MNYSKAYKKPTLLNINDNNISNIIICDFFYLLKLAGHITTNIYRKHYAMYCITFKNLVCEMLQTAPVYIQVNDIVEYKRIPFMAKKYISGIYSIKNNKIEWFYNKFENKNSIITDAIITEYICPVDGSLSYEYIGLTLEILNNVKNLWNGESEIDE